MDCETLRDRLAADPAALAAEFDEHAGRCAPCSAFAARLQNAEALIVRALRFDVDAARLAGAMRRRSAGSRWAKLGAGIAAGVVAVLTLWSYSGRGLRLNPDEFAAAVVEHWAHEPESLRPTESQVSLNDLAEVLYGAAEMGEPAASRVSYARICRVGGRFMPHLVVQGDTGPYMVLLMPGHALASAVPLASTDGGLAGRIIPNGSGSIAVLGSGSDELDAMESLLATSVAWAEGP